MRTESPSTAESDQEALGDTARLGDAEEHDGRDVALCEGDGQHSNEPSGTALPRNNSQPPPAPRTSSMSSPLRSLSPENSLTGDVDDEHEDRGSNDSEDLFKDDGVLSDDDCVRSSSPEEEEDEKEGDVF